MSFRYDADDAPLTPLRCLAILSAARDFGIARADIERVVTLDPLAMSPRELADALADTLEPRHIDGSERGPEPAV